jgi:hypothetical protein
VKLGNYRTVEPAMPARNRNDIGESAWRLSSCMETAAESLAPRCIPPCQSTAANGPVRHGVALLLGQIENESNGNDMPRPRAFA